MRGDSAEAGYFVGFKNSCTERLITTKVGDKPRDGVLQRLCTIVFCHDTFRVSAGARGRAFLCLLPDGAAVSDGCV